MKRSALKRSPMKKRIPEKAAAERPVRQAWLRAHPVCEWPHLCNPRIPAYALTVHEPWTRARGGPTDDPRNFVTLDAETNRLVSQDAGYMRRAYELGMLVSAAAGPGWLALGGRQPGVSKEEAIAALGLPAGESKED